MGRTDKIFYIEIKVLLESITYPNIRIYALIGKMVIVRPSCPQKELKMQKRTIESYMRPGAKIRLLKTLAISTDVALSKVLTKAERKPLEKFMEILTELSSDLDGRMFGEHPELSNDYVDVFYGDLSHEPKNEVDEKVIAMAKEVGDELFRKAD